jgi:hypothetical protein
MIWYKAYRPQHPQARRPLFEQEVDILYACRQFLITTEHRYVKRVTKDYLILPSVNEADDFRRGKSQQEVQ